MNKIHLGKTATSRSRRKKVVEEVSKTNPIAIGSPQSLSCQGGNDFIKYLLQKGYSDTTVKSFCSDVKKFKAWMEKENIEIENISYNDMTSYLQSFGNIAQHTKGCYLRGVKKYFNFVRYRMGFYYGPDYIKINNKSSKMIPEVLKKISLLPLKHKV